MQRMKPEEVNFSILKNKFDQAGLRVRIEPVFDTLIIYESMNSIYLTIDENNRIIYLNMINGCKKGLSIDTLEAFLSTINSCDNIAHYSATIFDEEDEMYLEADYCYCYQFGLDLRRLVKTVIDFSIEYTELVEQADTHQELFG